MPTQYQTPDDPRLYTDFNYYASKMGKKIGFHFTVYRLAGSDTFGRTQEPLDRTVTTIDQVIKELEQKLPAVRVVLDRTNQNHPVLHLVDKKLGKQSEVLDEQIDFQYSGVIGKLPDELQKVVPRIGPRAGGLVSGVGVETDLITQVDIDKQKRTIRDILTHSVHLDTYPVWIWEAITRQQDDGTWKTEVWFGGAVEALKNNAQNNAQKNAP